MATPPVTPAEDFNGLEGFLQESADGIQVDVVGTVNTGLQRQGWTPGACADGWQSPSGFAIRPG